MKEIHTLMVDFFLYIYFIIKAYSVFNTKMSWISVTPHGFSVGGKMFKLILALSLISISKSSKNVKNHDKCVGLRYFKERRVDLAVKHLLRSDTQNDEDTAIALAASFSMMARRLSTIEGEEEMERNALRSAVEYFEIAERGSSSKKMKIECVENIVQDAEQIVRSHGDALAWLGKRTEARELFERSGLWSDPTCRPRTKYLEAPNLEYIINDHVIITQLLPLLPFLREITNDDRMLTNRNDLLSRGWTSETAGLHRGKRRWWMRFLFVNGKEQEPTYPFLMNLVQRIPALNLRQGQIKLSLMRPGTSVRPHAGPTNGRLRVHCLLHNDMESHSYIRVGT